MQNIINAPAKSPRCLYYASLCDFIKSDSTKILGEIISAHHGDAQSTTVGSWEEEIRILKEQLFKWTVEDAYIIFEYNICCNAVSGNE